MNVITVDSGTTNTRATLWKDDCPIYTASRPVGVRMTAIEGNNNALKQAVSQVIQEALSYGNKKAPGNITCIGNDYFWTWTCRNPTPLRTDNL